MCIERPALNHKRHIRHLWIVDILRVDPGGGRGVLEFYRWDVFVAVEVSEDVGQLLGSHFVLKEK